MLRLPSLGELYQALRVRVFLCMSPTDMRKGFDTLAVLVRDGLGYDPLSGHLFLFVGFDICLRFPSCHTSQCSSCQRLVAQVLPFGHGGDDDIRSQSCPRLRIGYGTRRGHVGSNMTPASRLSMKPTDDEYSMPALSAWAYHPPVGRPKTNHKKKTKKRSKNKKPSTTSKTRADESL